MEFESLIDWQRLVMAWNKKKILRVTLLLVGLVLVAIIFSPWCTDFTTFGFHDWDSQTAHRYLSILSLLKYHQFPFWNPYACGGFPAWGYVEADTNIVSPWLLAYVFLPMSIAIRVETLGQLLLGMIGSWFLAGQFSKRWSVRLIPIVVWAINGRWALQAAAGHTWHLAYAWMPWVLGYFEQMTQSSTYSTWQILRQRKLQLAAMKASLCIAMMVYAGGIYPLPHTALILIMIALFRSIHFRTWTPIVALGLVAIFAFGFAAPKLFPVLLTMRSVPRLIESNEVLSLSSLWTLLTSRDQAFYSRPAQVFPYGWHEWGMYISIAGVLILGIGLVARSARAYSFSGVILLLLGLGNFGWYAPWRFLHRYIPIFQSQHVPSRFLYPAVLVLAVAAVIQIDHWVKILTLRIRWISHMLAIVLIGVGIDVALVARKPMEQSMWMRMARTPKERPFHYETNPPIQYVRRDWAGPMYLAMLTNTGVIQCYGTPDFGEKGAKAVTDPAYSGEISMIGKGQVTLKSWSPSVLVMYVNNVSSGSIIRVNSNYFDGWKSSVGEVISYNHALAIRMNEASDRIRVELYYVAPGFYVGMGVGITTIFAAFFLRLRKAFS